MNDNKIYIKEFTDFNDFTININPKRIVSKKDDVENPNIPFKNMLQKHIQEHQIFKVLLEEMTTIDFELEANGEAIIILRQKLSDSTDLRSSEIIERKIEKLSPNIKQKNVMIIRHLLEMADKHGFGMGVHNEDFYYYDGRFWKNKDKESLLSFLGEFAEKSGLETLNAQQFSVKDLLFKQFQIDAPIPKFNSQSSEIRIPLLNGTLILKNGKVELTGFKKEHFLKYMLPFDYNPEAKTPQFKKFLDRVLPDEELQKICFEFFGSSFSKMKHEKALFLLGDGANGKSVMYDVIRSLFGGENITGISLEDLCAPQSQATAALENTLINFCPDLGQRKIDLGIFKKIVSGEPILVKVVFKKPYMMENYGRLAFNCNSLPKETENTDAFHRRIIVIPFNATIPEEERDFNLAKKIISSELPGILNLIIEGLERLLEQGRFTQSQIVDKELKKYRTESNSILSFIDEEGFMPSSISKMPIDTFYELYREYCLKNGFHSYTKRNFNTQLRNAGFIIERSTHGYYHINYDKTILGIDDSATLINVSYCDFLSDEV